MRLLIWFLFAPILIFSWTNKTANLVGIPPDHTVAARNWGAAIYDLANDQVINFDGVYSPAQQRALYSNALWGYHVKTNEMYPELICSWARYDSTCSIYDNYGNCSQLIIGRTDTTITDRHPYSHMVYVHEKRSIYVYGGASRMTPGYYRNDPNAKNGHPTDTWRYDVAEHRWYHISHFYDGKGGEINPGARLEGAMAYDNDDAHLVFYGGLDPGSPEDHTWLFNLNTEKWRQVFPQNNPGNQNRHTMTSDVRRGCVYLNTGGAMWKFDVKVGNWEKLTGSGGGSKNNPMCYDVNHDVVMTSGGNLFNPKTNSWSSSGSGAASGAEFSNMAYDILHNYFVVATGTDIRTFKYGTDIIDTAGVYQYDKYNTTMDARGDSKAWSGDRTGIDARPNPFNPRTVIRVTRELRIEDRGQRVIIKIFNINGQIADILTSDLWHLAPGIAWNAARHPSGIYTARIVIEGKILTKKLILAK